MPLRRAAACYHLRFYHIVCRQHSADTMLPPRSGCFDAPLFAMPRRHIDDSDR